MEGNLLEHDTGNFDETDGDGEGTKSCRFSLGGEMFIKSKSVTCTSCRGMYTWDSCGT